MFTVHVFPFIMLGSAEQYRKYPARQGLKAGYQAKDASHFLATDFPAKQRAAIVLTVSHAPLALVRSPGFFLLLSLMEIRKSAFIKL